MKDRLYFLILILFLVSCSEKEEITTTSIFESNPSSQTPTNLHIEKMDPIHLYIEWEDNSDIEDGFILDKRKSDNQVWEQYAILDENIENFIDIVDDPNAQYYYRLCAFDDDDLSLYTSASIDLSQ